MKAVLAVLFASLASGARIQHTRNEAEPWQCSTSYYIDDAPGKLKNMSIKGMAMDDQTMADCSEKMLGIWPHTKSERVTGLRLFAAWKPEWKESRREASWEHLVKFVKMNNAKVFMGVDAHKNMYNNEKMWRWNMQLMKKLGKEHIMGMSFGNEMTNKHLSYWWWKKYYYWSVKKIAEMDRAGFKVPLTMVYSMGLVYELHHGGNYFMNRMYKKFPDRWVFSVNPYALWDLNLRPHGKSDCDAMSKAAVGIEYIQKVVGAFRIAVNKFTRKTDAPIWIGETGWSSPFSASMRNLENFCKKFCSNWSLGAYYANILSWDGSLIPSDLVPPEYIFFFTNRDSFDHGDRQPFGMIDTCENDNCKLQEKPTFR